MSCRKSTKRQSKRFLEVFVRERGSLTARNRPPQARNATPTQSALLRFCPTCTSPRLGQHRRWVPHASYTRSMPKSVLPPELWLKISAIFPRIFSLQSHSLVVPFDLSPNHFFSLPSPPTPNALRPRRRTEGIAPTVRGCKISPPPVEGDDCPADDLIDFIFDPPEPQGPRVPPRPADSEAAGDTSELAAQHHQPGYDVTFKYPDSPKAGAKPSPCPLFLSAPHLEHLHDTTTEVLPTLARSQPFTKLRTLDLPVECLSSVDLLPALLRCPAVDSLSLYTTNFIPTTVFEALPEGVLPLLESYRGPHNFAAAFLNGRTTKCEDVSIPARPHSLVSSLLKLHRNLESLSFSLNSPDLPPAVMHTIHSNFPNLTSFAIAEPGLSSTEIKSVLNSIPAHYNLEELTLRIQGRDKFNLWIPPAESAADAALCFNKVCTAVVRTYPAIQCVRFMHGSEGDSVAWRRSPRGGLFLPTGQ
ncbi:hypothetical protein B0H13DRAFT_2346310 [Mycena leptocephala]|nr:hypothetical protein B0H13DRAFT_2346310 [Mycena leptocephala]